MSVRRVFAMFVASVKMIVRDRTALFFSLAFPIVFMTLFGLIFGNASASRPDLDVVGTGPLVTALQHSKAVKLHVQPDERTALKRVHDGDETGALIVKGGTAHLYFQASSTVQGPILRAIVQGVADKLNIRTSGRPPLVRVTSVEHRGSQSQLHRLPRARPARDGDQPERRLRDRVRTRRVPRKGHPPALAPDAHAARRSSPRRAC